MNFNYFILILTLLSSLSFQLVNAVIVSKILTFSHNFFYVGTLMCSFALGNIVISPFISSISVKLGRKKTFILATLLFTLFQYLFGIDTNVYRIHLWRFLSGISNIQLPILLILISDNINKSKLSKISLKFSIFENLGFGLGRLIGGHINMFSMKLVFKTQIILEFLIIIFILFNYHDNVINKNLEIKNTNKNFKNKKLITIIAFINTISFTIFTNLINVYAGQYLKVSSRNIGNYMFIVSIFIIISITIINPKISKSVNNITISYILLLICTILWLSAFEIHYTSVIFITSITYFVFNIIFNSSVNSFILISSSQENVQQYLNYINLIKSMGIVIGAIISGWLYILNPTLPLLVVSILLLLTLIILVTNHKKIFSYKNKKVKN